jgi:GlpG protein
MIVSVAVALYSKLGTDYRPLRYLLITSLRFTDLPEVRSGEVWRLLTPIFIHFGPWHLLFNMLCFKDFGTLVEVRQGTLRLAMLVVIIGVLSNLGEFYFGHLAVFGGSADGRHHIFFGGMSGVIYGLLGYVWIRGKCDPSSLLAIDPRSVSMAILWFFLCLFRIIPNVANAAHFVGLAVGMIWGALPLLKRFSR